MTVTGIQCAFMGGLLSLVLASPLWLSAQAPELVYISNVTATQAGGRTLTSVEDQTRATLDRLGEALQEHGLSYSDVVVSNVFLKDTRHFQGMNGVYRTYFQVAPPTRATVQADLLDPDALIQISVVATDEPKEVITPDGLRSPELPYSWGIKVGNTVFLSGFVRGNRQLRGDISGQTRAVLEQVQSVLFEADMDLGDIVNSSVFLTDVRNFGPMNEVYREMMVDAPPPRATVGTQLMSAAGLIEIMMIAAKD